MTSKVEMELYRAAVLTFEELSLMLPSPGLGSQQRQAPATAAVKVDFSGPFGGRLIVIIHGELLPSITANMLGEINVPSRQEQLDALGEIANVICGNMLPGIGGTDAVFHIAAPQIISLTEAASAAAKAATQTSFGLEQGYVKLLLFVDGDIAAGGDAK